MNARRSAWVALMVVVLVGVWPLAGTSAQSGRGQGDVAYVASAAADGARVAFRVPGFLLVEEFFNAGGPIAQASIDSLGNADGFAAALYPGDTIQAAPPDVTQNYPLLVRSSTEDPEVESSQPGVRVAARSTATSATALGETGLAGDDGSGGGRLVTTAEAALADDRRSVLAAASTTAAAVTVGPVTVLGMSSGARAEVGLEGSIERSHHFEADAVRVEDVAFGVSPDGVVIAGQVLPALPAEIVQALAGLGVRIEFLAPEESPEGVTSAGLEISVATPGTSDVPSGITTVVLGRSAAHARLQPFGVGDSDDAGGDLLAGSDGTEPTAAGRGTSEAPVAPVDVRPAAVDDAPGARVARELPAEPARRADAGQAPVLVSAPAPGFSASGLYITVIIGAALVAAAAQIVRLFGVRLRWRS